MSWADCREVLARSDGTKLYLKTTVDEPEVAVDWAGPTGAHRAGVDKREWKGLPYGVECRMTISVYDAAGTRLGSVEYRDMF